MIRDWSWKDWQWGLCMQGLIMRISGWYEVDYAMVNKDHGLGCDYAKSW